MTENIAAQAIRKESWRPVTRAATLSQGAQHTRRTKRRLKSEMQRKTVESRKECARLAIEKAYMTKEMAQFRGEGVKRMQEEKDEMQRRSR